jgi:hypothetical protein
LNPPVDAKPNIDEGFIHVKPSLVDSGVSQLGDSEVDMAPFFPPNILGKSAMTLLIGFDN